MLAPKEFEQLINQREGERLEFKREMPASSDLAKLVTAFYNTNGGAVVFGVEDSTQRLMGVSNPQGIEEGIVNILRSRCSLDVMPAIEFVAYRDMEFVVALCPQGTRKPYLISGETRPYIRVGSGNRVAQGEEIRRLYIEGSEGGFESLPCQGVDVADLSEQLITDYVRQREKTSGRPLGLSWEEEVACVRFKGTDVVSYIDRRDLRGPLYRLVDDAEQFIYRHMKVGRRIEGFEGVEYREYPQATVREAIVNAVVHRDYSRQG
ncbi:MAG: hypothetical protein B6243_09610 [Anaerolineaceae bacterium 4572_5.2]|nr:MAG: hypothetical protein B6243_09610 [Anaerolineaceae bacterium 4572_5.2]